MKMLQAQTLTNSNFVTPVKISFPPDVVRAATIVWRITEKIIRTVLCCSRVCWYTFSCCIFTVFWLTRLFFVWLMASYCRVFHTLSPAMVKALSQAQSRVWRTASCPMQSQVPSQQSHRSARYRGMILWWMSSCRAWTVFGSMPATRGAALEEVMHETEEMDHREVWLHHLAQDEDDGV